MELSELRLRLMASLWLYILCHFRILLFQHLNGLMTSQRWQMIKMVLNRKEDMTQSLTQYIVYLEKHFYLLRLVAIIMSSSFQLIWHNQNKACDNNIMVLVYLVILYCASVRSCPFGIGYNTVWKLFNKMYVLYTGCPRKKTNKPGYEKNVPISQLVWL